MAANKSKPAKSKATKHPLSRDDVDAILKAILQPETVPSDQIMGGLARASGLDFDAVLSMAKVTVALMGEDPDTYLIPASGIIP